MYMSDYPREILNGLGRAAEAGDYQILLIHGGDYRNYMDIERIDALVILGFRVVSNAWQAEMVDMFQRFNRRQYPYVVINNGCDTLPVPSINLDNRHGVKLIADLIRRKGYSSVGFIGELTTNPQSCPTCPGPGCTAIPTEWRRSGCCTAAERCRAVWSVATIRSRRG